MNNNTRRTANDERRAANDGQAVAQASARALIDARRMPFVLLILLAFLALPALMFSPVQGSPEQAIAISGAKIFTLAGEPIENGTVVIKGGKIEAAGRNVRIPSGAKVINGKGLQVYPGIFDSVTRLGLAEIDSISATNDANEMGTYVPQLAAATAVNPASEHIPVARANGVTHALAVPGLGGGGAVIGGQACAMNLSGFVIDEMLISRSVAMVLNWPTMSTGSFDFNTFSFRRRPFAEAKQEYEKRVNELTDWLDKVRHYAQAMEKGSRDKFERDLELEAAVPVVRGKLPLLVAANDDRDIKNAVEFCEKQKLKMILAGGSEAWKVKDLLKEKKIPVILGPVQSLPTSEDDPYDKPNSNPGELYAAGVKIAFATFDSSDSRTLPYEAANSVSYGLPWEEALKAITVNPAEIFGISDKVGTIEPGKIANLIVTNGDPMEIRTEIRYLFINGQLTSLENKHLQLFEKYRKR